MYVCGVQNTLKIDANQSKLVITIAKARTAITFQMNVMVGGGVRFYIFNSVQFQILKIITFV